MIALEQLCDITDNHIELFIHKSLLSYYREFHLCLATDSMIMFKKPLVQVPVKYGTVASALLALLFVVLYSLGKHPLFVPLFLDIRLLMLPMFMFIAMKDFRDSQNNGVLHFWQGLTVGFLTFTTVAVFTSIFIMLMAEVSGGFLQEYISARLELLEANKVQFSEALNEQFVQGQIDALPLTRPFDLALDYFWKTIAIGIFLNIILAVVLRKQPKT